MRNISTPFACSICKKEFIRLEFLGKHVELRHPNQVIDSHTLNERGSIKTENFEYEFEVDIYSEYQFDVEDIIKAPISLKEQYDEDFKKDTKKHNEEYSEILSKYYLQKCTLRIEKLSDDEIKKWTEKNVSVSKKFSQTSVNKMTKLFICSYCSKQLLLST